MTKDVIWHCENCGYEYTGSQYDWHPKSCPQCRKQKWTIGKTANCSKCTTYFICHEPMKGMLPEHGKTCAYFREEEKHD